VIGSDEESIDYGHTNETVIDAAEGQAGASEATDNWNAAAPAPIHEPAQQLPDRGHPVTFTASGRGPTYQAWYQQNYMYLGEFVLPVPVPSVDLEASSPERYIMPRVEGQFEAARQRLLKYGVVVLSALPGTGRRTTALRLLTTPETAISPDDTFDLEPEWAEPKASLLPPDGGQGYVLDLSETASPSSQSHFGSELASYGKKGLPEERFLVVLANPEHWAGEWVEATLDFTIEISSPHAKDLVAGELEATGKPGRVDWLSRPELAHVWKTDPPAREARRLARILAKAPESGLAVAVDEFTGWHSHIDRMLNKHSNGGAGEPGLLSTRATIWAGALLDGGQARSILKASDTLLGVLEIDRSPAEVLADATASRRLSAAGLIVDGQRAYHAQDKHDLASAILVNLWEQFPTQSELMRNWAAAVAADPEIADDDAHRVTSALLDLATRRQDGEILDSIAARLTNRRRYLAVEALTEAALNAEMGPYVRQQLYDWAKSSKFPETTRLVVEICGGTFGERLPERALTRLRWATGRSEPGSPHVIAAFENLMATAPDTVRKAIEAWLKPEKIDGSALSVFLALTCAEAGPPLLVANAATESGHRDFVRAWQGLFDDAATAPTAESQATRWSKLAEDGTLPTEELISLFADVYRLDLANNKLNRFLKDDDNLGDTFWGKVLMEAVYRNRQDSNHTDE